MAAYLATAHPACPGCLVCTGCGQSNVYINLIVLAALISLR